MAWPSKLKKALVPSHFDCRLVPWAPPVTQMSLKAVLSKSSAAANVISANPSPRSRRDNSARMTATTEAMAAPMSPPTRKLKPRCTENTAAVNAPMPANVAWHSDNCPAMPVISVTERQMIDRVRPLLKTVSQVAGIQVSMETMKPANRTYHNVRMMRSMVGARVEAAMGCGGGSIVARGSRLESRLRSPGRMSRAAAMAKNGSEGTTAAFQKLFGGMYPCNTVVTTPMRTATPAAMGSERSMAQAAAAMAVTVRVTNSSELKAP